MTALNTGQAAKVFSDGVCDHVAFYAIKNVTAADTIDVGPAGTNDFLVVKRAGFVSATGNTIAACTIAGTVLTFAAGPSADGVWLIVVGVAT